MQIMSEDREEIVPLRVAWIAGPATIHRWGAVLEPLAHELHQQGCEILLCCPETSPVEVLDIPGVETHRYRQPWWFLGKAKARRTVARHVERFEAAAVHALEPSLAGLTIEAARQAGVPCVANCFGLRDVRALNRQGRELAGVFAASETIAAACRDHRRLREKTEVFRPPIEAHGPARCLPELPRVCTVLADAMGGHRQTLRSVLEAYRDLRQDEATLALFIMDAGRNERRLRSDARRLGVSPDVTFVDPQPDMDYQEIIAGADVFLSAPSRGELNLHTLQAMGEGVPVVAGPDEAADFLSDDETALVCDPMDVETVTLALLEMLEDPEAVERRTQAALGRVRDLHAVGQAAAELVAIYRQVTAPPSADVQQDEPSADEPLEEE